MSVFGRTSKAVEEVLIAWPLIGVLAVFAAIGMSVYLAYQTRQAAKANGMAIRGQIVAKDATIASKDAQILDLQKQLAAKDVAITGETAIIGQLYNGAVALQQQVTALGGQAKTIPITLPRGPTALTPGTVSPVPSGSPTARPPTASPAPSQSPAVNLQVQCPIICSPK